MIAQIARMQSVYSAVLSVILLTNCAPASPVSADAGAVDGATDASPRGARVFASRVVRFEPGEGAGFGQSRMPDIVLGAPRGAGDLRGGTDVVSLGRGGQICLSFEPSVIVDGEGPDLIVFENPFIVSGSPEAYVELGEVSVSEDGVQFVSFACDRQPPYRGCAGVTPVYSHPDNSLDPTDSRYAGGDALDLREVGLRRARVVCVRDLATRALSPPSSGFDLDAIAAIHSE
ncbi:MAG: cell surface protein [Deltaproteobacteria bacterium]|nr:cell surface protein [Deltaproteobacteria bacterium]